MTPDDPIGRLEDEVAELRAEGRGEAEGRE